ncbi:class I SAM-dependent methyltransferase, partial [Crocinitomicaceae bacterium]|nr:class I SAM-dependent methyltransferase [Crocinitomicaceae bacterium]
TGLDIENALVYESQITPDVYWDGVKMPFEDSTFDSCMATEVLEHCPNPEIVLKEVSRVLKPEGTLFFTVPFIWNLHEAPHDEYRYTPFALKRHLLNSGFKDVQIKSSGGWHSSLAMMLGLWVRRSPMGSFKRKILSRLIKPIMKTLLKRDIGIHSNFKEGQMIPNLFGTAKK